MGRVHGFTADFCSDGNPDEAVTLREWMFSWDVTYQLTLICEELADLPLGPFKLYPLRFGKRNPEQYLYGTLEPDGHVTELRMTPNGARVI